MLVVTVLAECDDDAVEHDPDKDYNYHRDCFVMRVSIGPVMKHHAPPVVIKPITVSVFCYDTIVVPTRCRHDHETATARRNSTTTLSSSVSDVPLSCMMCVELSSHQSLVFPVLASAIG